MRLSAERSGAVLKLVMHSWMSWRGCQYQLEGHGQHGMRADAPLLDLHRGA